jgi:hypothetical protein
MTDIETDLIEAAKSELKRRGTDPAIINQTEALQKREQESWKDATRSRLKKNKQHPVKFKEIETEAGKQIVNATDDGIDSVCRFYETTGFTDKDGCDRLLTQVASVQANSQNVWDINSTLAMLNGIQPQDPLEGMLAGQMVAVHNMAMEYARRAMDKTSTNFDHNDRYINRTSKLMNLFTRQMEALQKYRTKGQQRITVQHVQVGQGGQAIIGDVLQEPQRSGH